MPLTDHTDLVLPQVVGLVHERSNGRGTHWATHIGHTLLVVMGTDRMRIMQFVTSRKVSDCLCGTGAQQWLQNPLAPGMEAHTECASSDHQARK